MWRGTAQIPVPVPCQRGAGSLGSSQSPAVSSIRGGLGCKEPPRSKALPCSRWHSPEQFATRNRELEMQKLCSFRQLQSSLLGWPRPHCNSEAPFLPPDFLFSSQVLILKTISHPSPGWCSSVDWEPACKQKGSGFDSQSGHMPGLWGRSPIWGTWGATTHWCFSPSLLLPFPSL